MADNAWQDMLPANGGFTRDELLAGLIRRTCYVLGSAEDTQTIDLQTSLMVAKGQDFYWYDATDTVSAHDGTSVLVDLSGRRYKLTDALRAPRSVKDRLSTPPGGPSIGDAYLVTAGATGDWAGQDDDIAVWTATGWVFVAPVVGAILFIEDETAFHHYDGAWEGGLGSLSLASASVTPVEYGSWGRVSVEDEVNAPPGSPADGQVWLVGTSPTGDFAGQNGKLAVRRAGAWEFVAPYAGARIWDADAAAPRTYEGGAWAADPAITPVETETRDLSVGGPYSVVDFTDLDDFVTVRVTMTDMPSDVQVRVSADNGVSFDAGGSDYKSGSTSSTLDVPRRIGPGLITFSLHGLNKSALKTAMAAGSVDGTSWGGIRDAAQVDNAIRLMPSAGTWSAGLILVEKLRG